MTMQIPDPEFDRILTAISGGFDECICMVKAVCIMSAAARAGHCTWSSEVAPLEVLWHTVHYIEFDLLLMRQLTAGRLSAFILWMNEGILGNISKVEEMERNHARAKCCPMYQHRCDTCPLQGLAGRNQNTCFCLLPFLI